MRINLFGGPGCGKSTTAAWLFSELKLKQKSIELVTEYCKAWAVQKRHINEFDQIYLFGKQMQYEYRFLNSGIKNIVTDSPTDLSVIYSKIYYDDINISIPISQINKEYNNKYPSFNILLERNDKPYVQEGRYQTYEKAKEIDNTIRNYLLTNYHSNNKLLISHYLDRETILKSVLGKINE